jgi:hypothetical protein
MPTASRGASRIADATTPSRNEDDTAIGSLGQG